MNYSITTEITFSAAHSLRGYEGDCSRLHGHNWHVEVSVTTPRLDDNGFAIDFLVLDDILKNAVAPLDHRNLNEVHPFDMKNPTAENIAAYIFESITSDIQEHTPDASVSEVTVWEMGKYRASIGRK